MCHFTRSHPRTVPFESTVAKTTFFGTCYQLRTTCRADRSSGLFQGCLRGFPRGHGGCHIQELHTPHQGRWTWDKTWSGDWPRTQIDLYVAPSKSSVGKMLSLEIKFCIACVHLNVGENVTPSEVRVATVATCFPVNSDVYSRGSLKRFTCKRIYLLMFRDM